MFEFKIHKRKLFYIIWFMYLNQFELSHQFTVASSQAKRESGIFVYCQRNKNSFVDLSFPIV